MHRTHARTTPGARPAGAAQSHPGPPPESTLAVTVENPVCPKQPELAECSSMACRRTDWMRAPARGLPARDVVLALAPIAGNTAPSPGRPARPGGPRPAPRPDRAGGARGPPPGRDPGPRPVAALDATNGTVQGARNCNARGEILRPLQDRQRRRRSARTRSSIKSESLGIEDDQTPS